MWVALSMVNQENLQSLIFLSKLFLTVSKSAFITSLTNFVFPMFSASDCLELFGIPNTDPFDDDGRLHFFSQRRSSLPLFLAKRRFSSLSISCSMTPRTINISLAHTISDRALTGYLGDLGFRYLIFLSKGEVKILLLSSNHLILTQLFMFLCTCHLLLLHLSRVLQYVVRLSNNLNGYTELGCVLNDRCSPSCLYWLGSLLGLKAGQVEILEQILLRYGRLYNTIDLLQARGYGLIRLGLAGNA